MPEKASRKYVTNIDYIADMIGADVNRDLLKMTIAAQDIDKLETRETRIPIALQQDTDGAIYLILKQDNVGLAKSGDVSDLKGADLKDFTTLESDVEFIGDRMDIPLSQLQQPTKAPSTIRTASKTLSGSAGALSSGEILAVACRAQSNNSGTVYVGHSGFSQADGYPLTPGETVTLPVNNLNKAHALAAVSGDEIRYAWSRT